MTALSTIFARLKANYGATAGEIIAGRLKRGGDGKFTSADSPATDKLKKTIQAINTKYQQKQAKKQAKKKVARPKKAAAKKQPKAAKQAAPKKSDAQKQAERDAAKQKRRAEMDAQAKAERQANRQKVAEQAGLGKNVHEALTEFASPDEKIQLSPRMAEELSKRGLVEKDANGEYRMTAQGRQYVRAADSGDVRAAADAISEGGDQVTQASNRAAEQTRKTAEREAAKAERQRNQAARKADVEKRRAEAAKKKQGGGGKAKPSAEQKEAAKQAERQANRQRLAPETGVDPLDADALAQAATQPGTPNAALLSLGLQNDRGEATDQGRRYLNALERGDARGAQAALQDARQRLERERAAQARRDAIAVRRATKTKASEITQTTLSVYKADDGQWHWIARSSTAYRDKDNEIVSRAAHHEDIARMKASGEYGPLRWWHVGSKGERTPVDIGDCTGAAFVGNTRIEWGTFRHEVFAKAIKATDGISLGYTYSPVDITPDRVYTRIRTFERSVCPAGYARNHYTGITAAHGAITHG